MNATAASRDRASATMDVESVETHFVAFVCAGGALYELDGRRAAPVSHGACDAAALLPRSLEAIKGFMERDPEEVRFTITAMVPEGAQAQG